MSDFIEGLSITALADLQKYNSELVSTINNVDKVNTAFSKLKTPGASNDATKGLSEEYKKQEQAIKDLQGQILLLTEARKKGNAQNIEESVNNQILARNAKNAVLQNSQLAGAYANLSAQQNKASRTLQDLIARGRTAEQTQRQYNRELRNAQNEFNGLNRRVLQADNAVGRFNRNVGNYPKQAILGVRELIGAFGILGGVSLFASIAKDIFNTTKELQSMNFALKQVVGSTSEVASTQQFLKRISEDYGIELIALTQSYTAFYAASKNAIDAGQISASQIQDIFQSVSKASGAIGLSVEQQKGAFLALQQMISKGTVQAEEIRGQLAERLPGAFGILAKSMGVTEKQLNKLLKDGKVLAAEVLPAFAKELEKAYGVENLERVETLNAETTRLSNTWTEFVAVINSGNGAVSKFFTSTISGLNNVLGGFKRIFQSNTEIYDESNAKGIAKGMQDQINALEQINDLELRRYSAQVSIDDNQPYIGKLIEEINLLEKRNIALKEADPLFIKGSGKTYAEYSKNKTEIEALNYQLGLYEGKIKGASKVLDELNPKQKTETEEKKKKVKLQKDEIDYLAKAYELNKINSEIIAQNNKRIMDDEEKNFEDRKNAADNYYAYLKHLNDIKRDEEIRINDLAYKQEKKRYEYNITQGTANFQTLEQLEYKHVIEQGIIRANYEDQANQLTIEKAKALQGVLRSITDQAYKNSLSEKNIEDLRQVGLYLKNISGATTLKQFDDLDNKLTKIADDEEERNNQALRRDLETNRLDQERIKNQLSSSKTLEKDNESLNNLKAQELEINTKLIESDNERAKKFADLYETMANSTKDYLSSITDSFLNDAGFGSLSKMFDQVTYQFVNDLGEIETKTSSTFQKMIDQAGTATQKFQVAFQGISEIVQETFNFLNQNQQAYFDNQYARLEKEKDVAIMFAGESTTAKAEIEKQYEERKRQIRIKEAKATKDTAIFNAIVNTAQAVVAALPNIALSVIAELIGAAQIALISAQPLPEFWKGTENAPQGFAWVDERGPEIHLDRFGKIKSLGSEKGANLRYLESGDKIIPHNKFDEGLNNILLSNGINYSKNSKPNYDGIIANEIKALRIDLRNTKSDSGYESASITKTGTKDFFENLIKGSESLNDRVNFKIKKT